VEETTLTLGDVSQVRESLARWDDSREVRELNDVYERVRALEDAEEMSLQTLLSLRYITHVAFWTGSGLRRWILKSSASRSGPA